MPRADATPVTGAGVRAAAAKVIDAVMHGGRSLKAELSAAQQKIGEPRDCALLEAIVMAALRNAARYEATLAAWLPRPLPLREGELRALLFAGFAQLDAMALPAHAAVGATVEATRLLRRHHHAGMVNAVLRRATREPLPAADPAGNWPEWLQQRLQQDWPDAAATIIAASAEAPPMWLRVNRRLGTRDAYAATLRDAGFDPQVPEQVADALLLAQPVPVANLPGFEQGCVSVQDGSAQLLADALQLRPGMRVLDACAAPGGKTAHLLEREPGLRVTALDIDPRRVRRMQEGFQRLGMAVEARAADAKQPDTWWDGTPFDIILIDAPCSATGIVRRQPDILMHRREEDVASLAALQARLLDALWRLLAPGGQFIYATCSILAAENADQVQAFLQRRQEATLAPLDARFGRDTGFGHQRLPGDSGMDGFFYARLRGPEPADAAGKMPV